MFHKIKASGKLYLLVFISMSFILGLGVYGIHETKLMNQNTKSLYEDRVLPVHQLADLRFFYLSILSTAQNCFDGTTNFDEAENSIQSAQDSLKTNLNAYLNTYLTPEEKILVQQTTPLISQLNRDINKLKIALSNKDTLTFHQIVRNELVTNKNKIISKIASLIHLQISVGNQINQRNLDAYKSSKLKFISLICISLVLMILISYFLLKNLNVLVRNLKGSNVLLKEASDKYKTFLKYAGEAILIADKNLNIIEANDSAGKLLGYHKEELLKMRIYDIMPSNEQVSLTKTIDFLDSKESSVHERILKRKDDSVIDTEVNVKKLDAIGYISIIRDISEQKKAEKAIKESEEKYRYLFQNNPACIILWDLQTLKVIEVNETVLKKYGYSQEEWNNMSVLNYRYEEEHEVIRLFAENMLKGDSSVVRRVWKHLKKNGEEMMMEISSHKIIYNHRPVILSIGNDVTEKLKAEDELKRSEENFRTLIDHAADSIFIVNTNGEVLDVNKSAEELLQYTKKELIGKSVLEFHPEEVKKTIPNIWSTLIQNKSYTDERQLLRKDGTLVDVEISRKMFPHAAGAIAIVRDITERKLAEEKLKQSEERHRTLIENISDGIVLVDENLSVIYQSPSVQRITGFTLEDRKNRKAIDFIHPNDLEICKNQYKLSTANPKIPIQFQYRSQHKDGHYIWIDVFITNLLDQKGIHAYVVIYRDITQRKKFEEQQSLMTSIVNSTDDAIISKNLNSIITSWNHGAEKILGYKKEDIVGQNIRKIFPKDLLNEESEIINKIKLGLSIDHYETKRIRKDGEIIIVSVTISPIKDATGEVVGASTILRDITKQKHFETQLKLRNEKLIEIAFLQSHMVRKPVANIIGLINLINVENLNDPINSELFPMLELSAKELDDMVKEIMQNINDISKASSTK